LNLGAVSRRLLQAAATVSALPYHKTEHFIIHMIMVVILGKIPKADQAPKAPTEQEQNERCRQKGATNRQGDNSIITEGNGGKAKKERKRKKKKEKEKERSLEPLTYHTYQTCF
jgi:hypothetical protein